MQRLLHLKRHGQGLDEDGGPDAAFRNLQPLLGEREHVGPQSPASAAACSFGR